jgi:hypothetical protein
MLFKRVQVMPLTLPASARQKRKTVSALTCGYLHAIGGMLHAFTARQIGSKVLLNFQSATWVF